jgi:photosystem II stability/assembly factor-like uncharacterized protein
VIEHTSFSGRFIVGDGGTVFQSDGSRTVWTPIDVGTSADLLAVQQSSLGGPWVAGDAGVVRVHTGGTWFHRDIPHASEDFVLFTGGSGTSYAAGTGGSIYRTVNSGGLWTLQSSGTTNALHDGAGGTTAYCVGDNGTILKTTDTGVTWIAKPSGTTRHLYAFRSAGGGVLLAGGEDGTLLRSTNGGDSWTTIATPTVSTIRDIDWSGQNSSWLLLCGDGGLLLRSTDGGLTWCHILTGTTTNLNGVDMVTNAEYIVVGEGGLLLRSTNQGGGCANVTDVPFPGATPGRLELSAAWPQPIRTSGVMHLSVDSDQWVEAMLVDVGGRRVATLHQGRVRAGQPAALTLDARSLEPGIYFVRASGETKSVTERVVILN